MSENKIKKVALEVKLDEKDPELPTTPTKEAFKALINTYALKNPVKYEKKKAKLKAKLASL